ncbi:hypothetical protein HQ533_01400 [Candidatus Woesearchaeota archaeon]|nr:hypothetical protein [Candidatus Woesearchaeota archaeon]
MKIKKMKLLKKGMEMQWLISWVIVLIILVIVIMYGVMSGGEQSGNLIDRILAYIS